MGVCGNVARRVEGQKRAQRARAERRLKAEMKNDLADESISSGAKLGALFFEEAAKIQKH